MKQALLLLMLLPLSMAASDFDTAVNELVARNLGLRVEAARAEASVENIKAENTLAGPEVEFSHMWGTTVGAGNKWDLSVSQSFDWPGLYKARRDAARTASTAMQFLTEANMLDARKTARSLLVDYIYNSQQIGLQKKIVANADSLFYYYKEAVERGAATRLDYNKTVLERVSALSELHSLEAQRETVMAQIREFASGADITHVLALAGNSYPDFQYAMPSAEELRRRDPAYAAAMANAEAAESMVKVSRLSSMPGFSLGFVHATEGGENFNGFSVGISLPSWSRKHNTAAARLEAEAAMIDAELALSRRQAQLSADYRLIENYRRVISETEPAVTDRAQYELLDKALKSGQITYLTYLQEINYFISAYRDYLTVLYEYNQALLRTRYYD